METTDLHPARRAAPAPHAADARRPFALALVDAFAIAAFAALALDLLLRLVARRGGATAPALFAALAGWALADLVSGLAHWTCDTFFHETTPLLGRAFIRPFREHHLDPTAIARHGFLEVNGSNCLVLAPVMLAARGLGDTFLHDAALLAFAVAIFGTNQFHKWAHLEGRLPPAVASLQSTRLILSREHHLRHHRAPHREAYCITSGWMDLPLDRWRVLPRVERFLRGRRGFATADLRR